MQRTLWDPMVMPQVSDEVGEELPGPVRLAECAQRHQGLRAELQKLIAGL